MPQIKSAIKRVETNRKANLRNVSQMSAMRTAVKKFETAVAANSDDRTALYTQAISAVDRAKSKGLIKANKAANAKSRLTKLNK
ncbi:SSU ribosomal protein S20p [Agrilactobacillus composti DSM 18527 = JCM 14202]|nr:30S ribosomal protein S20 [Agrilactobacillus composti]MCH4171071.1 30S ribosomal protein S20 [Lactobacillus sp.]GAF39078.1 SSU ribosomal protein S20p [Agrilactobacillus composti DSM 18527 = JCM 14202]